MIHNSKIVAFRQSEHLRQHFSQLLNDPVFKQLLEAIKEEAFVKARADMIPGLSPDVTDARDASYRRGVYQTIHTIECCIHPLNQAPDEVEEEIPFEHTLPKELRSLPKQLRK